MYTYMYIWINLGYVGGTKCQGSYGLFWYMKNIIILSNQSLEKGHGSCWCFIHVWPKWTKFDQILTGYFLSMSCQVLRFFFKFLFALSVLICQSPLPRQSSLASRMKKNIIALYAKETGKLASGHERSSMYCCFTTRLFFSYIYLYVTRMLLCIGY